VGIRAPSLARNRLCNRLAGLTRRTVAILGTRYRDFSVEEAVLSTLGVDLVAGTGASADEIVEVAGAAEVLLLASGPRLDSGTIARLGCRGLVRYGVGVEKIDLEAAARHGMWVVRVADYGTEAVASHAVTLALAGLRRLREADARVRAGEWGFADLRPLHLFSTLTAGVVGSGRIGSYAAQLFAGLGFRVLAHDPVAPAPEGAEAVSLEQLLAESDVVSLHAPGPADGRPLLGTDELALLREGSVLVNTARGVLVDFPALAVGLRAGRPRVAALDVYPSEPPDLAVFAGVEGRLLLSPHMAWYTEESEQTMRRSAAEEARRILLGERPLDPVAEPQEVIR
jgi:D-3-phosphoglycerate dehydrogenase / 2-oxoglutarate reductase